MVSLVGSFLSFLTSVGYIILALLVLMFMIVIHELGHYVAGKVFKFKINEFSIGFGKALFSKTMKSGEKFSVRLIPLGGYCAFEGEDENHNDPRAFNNQAWWKRLIVLSAGAVFNFISAILFCVVLLSVFGAGYSEVEKVEGPNAGIVLVGDVITHVGIVGENETPASVNMQHCSFITGGFNYLVSSVQDETTQIVLRVQRQENGKTVTKNLVVTKYLTDVVDKDNQLVLDENNEVVQAYLIGVTPSYYSYSFGKSLLKAVPYAFQLAWECLVVIGRLFIGQYGLKELGGPITTISAIAGASSQSLLNLILLFPLIAVNLAVFNLLPIPALDGARMVFVGIEAVRKKPVNRNLEAKIHTIGLIVLFAFVLIIDFLHIIKF